MKYCHKTIVIAIVLLYCHCASAQTITGVVCNKATKLPVSDVCVYLDGTSVNTVTNVSGKFELKTRSEINTKLVLHHLSYETVFIEHPFERLPDTLYIEERMHILPEITVNAGRFTRKQKMKAFREQFLGMSRAGKSCSIINEDDIQFSINQRTGRFSASSEKPVEVVNNYLGYQLTFVLIDFWVEYPSGIPSLDNDWVRSSFFAVHSLFTDLQRDSRRYKRRRDNIYELSSNYFFKSLTGDVLKENRFIMFNKGFPVDYRQYLSIKDTLSLKKISIIPDIDSGNPAQPVRNIRNDTTLMNRMIARGLISPNTNINTFPAIIDSLSQNGLMITGTHTAKPDNNKEKIFYSGPKLYRQLSVLFRRKIQSDIYFLADSFLVDSYGNCSPIDKISFAGQMGKNRAGDMLPVDYELD